MTFKHIKRAVITLHKQNGTLFGIQYLLKDV